MGCVQSNLQDDGSDIHGTVGRSLASPNESKTDELPTLGSTNAGSDKWIVECLVKTDNSNSQFLFCLLNLPLQGADTPATVIVGSGLKFPSSLDTVKLYCTNKGNIQVPLTPSRIIYEGPFVFIDVSEVEALSGNGSDCWSTIVADEDLQYHSVTIWSDYKNPSLVPVQKVGVDSIVFSTNEKIYDGSPVCLGRLGENNLNIVGICGPSDSRSSDHTAHRFTRETFRKYILKRSESDFYIGSGIDPKLYLYCKKSGSSEVNCWYGTPNKTKPLYFFVYPAAALGNEVVVVLESVNWSGSCVGIKDPKQTTLGTKVDCVYRYTEGKRIDQFCTFTVDSNFMKGGLYYPLRSFSREDVCLQMQWADRSRHQNDAGGEVRCMVAESAKPSTEIQFSLVRVT